MNGYRISYPKEFKKNQYYIFPYFILPFVTTIIFFNTLDNGLVYDDSVTIVNNNFIKNWKNISSLFSFRYFILSGEISYRPVVTLTYFIDYFFYGSNPTGLHLSNLLLQMANTVLFYVFLRNITKESIFAFISALLFTIHPVITETVNVISYREDLLAAFFSLIAFILFLKCDREFISRRTFLMYYVCSLFSLLFALFSKEMAVTLPLLMVLFRFFSPIDDTPWKEFIKRAKGIYIGYFLVTCFYLIIQFGVFKDVSITLEEKQLNLFVMFKVLATYIKLFFLPFGLNADYLVPPINHGISSFIVSVFVVGTFVIILLRFGRNNALFCFFSLWLFITLLPVSNIVPIGNVMAERYLYIPIMGFLGCAGIMVKDYIFKKFYARICFALVLFAFGILSIYRNGIWYDEFSLWYYTLQREPNSVRAYHNLGVVYSAKGLYGRAEEEYKKTLEINPGDAEAHYNLGNVYEKKGRIDEAIKEYKEAIQYNPYYAEAYNNLGMLLKKKDNFDAAVRMYKKAISCNPFNIHFYNNLGLIYSKNGYNNEAVAAFKKSLDIDPDVASTHNYLGNVYKETGNPEEALSEYNKALSLNSKNASVHNNLGIVYTNKGLFDDAIEEFKAVFRLDPKMADAHNNLGIVYAKTGKESKAIEELNRAVTLGMDNEDVHNNLAAVYMQNGLMDKAIGELKKALTYNPDDSNTHCNLGNAYASKGNDSKAIVEFRKAININPKDADLYYYLGNAHMRKKEYHKAKDAFIKAIQFQPNNSEVHRMLGIIYANYLYDRSGALFHLNKTLKIDPSQPMAQEIRKAVKELMKKQAQEENG